MGLFQSPLEHRDHCIFQSPPGYHESTGIFHDFPCGTVSFWHLPISMEHWSLSNFPWGTLSPLVIFQTNLGHSGPLVIFQTPCEHSGGLVSFKLPSGTVVHWSLSNSLGHSGPLVSFKLPVAQWSIGLFQTPWGTVVHWHLSISLGYMDPLASFHFLGAQQSIPLFQCPLGLWCPFPLSISPWQRYIGLFQSYRLLPFDM